MVVGGKADPGMTELMKPKLAFAQSNIRNGQVICSQVEQAMELHDLEVQGLYSNPIHSYGFLQNCVMNFFRSKLEKADNDRLLAVRKKTYFPLLREEDSFAHE
ncbi:hypothetical protein EDD16DRAFT_1649956 [Pisolithus croceorrhizus]|nr:hypothetical protein EDD16DRAFT_1649956 [Pisolithus croceorrhizus]